MSALGYWSAKEDEETTVEEEEDTLDRIFDTCYDDLIEACKEGKVSDDNAIIGAVLSLMERIIPKLLDAYKKDEREYASRCLAFASALRVTTAVCMPWDKFMALMLDPEMARLDKAVDYIAEHGKSEASMEELMTIFKNLKTDKRRPDIYG